MQTLEIAEADEELSLHETIRKYSADFSYAQYRVIRDICMMMLAIKFSTIVAHTRRSLALSAPRNIWTAMVKYIGVPGLFAWSLEYSRYQQLMSNLQDL